VTVDEQKPPIKENLLHNLDKLYEIRSGQKDLVIKLMSNHESRMEEIIEAKASGKEPKYDFKKINEEYQKNLAFFMDEVEISDKLIDRTARFLANDLLKYDTIKRAKGRPKGSVTKDRNYEIKLMHNILLYDATYEDENGEIHSQYRHYDTRTKEDLSKMEIYHTIAEYYPALSPERIKDIVNKETI